MAVDQFGQLLELAIVGDRLGLDHLRVVELVEIALDVIHVGDATAHASAEVLAGGPEDHGPTVGHVFTAVVAASLDHTGATRVAHAEALASQSGREQLAPGRTIHHGVADDRVLRGGKAGTGGRADDDLPAGHPLADVVVGLTGQVELHPAAEEGSEALTRAPFEHDIDRAFREPVVAVHVGDRSRQLGADVAVGVLDLVFERDRGLLLDRPLRLLEDLIIQRVRMVAVVAVHLADPRDVVPSFLGHVLEDRIEVDHVRLRVIGHLALAQVFGAADQVVELAHPELRHDLADLLGDRVEEVDDVLFGPLELRTVLRVLGGDPDRAGVQVALADIDAAHRDQGDRAEVELLGTEDRCVDDIHSGAQTTVGAERHPLAEIVQHQHLLGLGKTDLPGQASVFDGRQWRRAGAPLMAADQDDIGVRLGDASGDGTDAGLGDQLHADARARVDLLEIVDQLGQVLDRIDVVVRRRADELHAGLGVAQPGDDAVHLVARQLPPLTWLRALRHLDLDLFAVGEVLGTDPEPARGHLFDLAVLRRIEAHRILAALARIGFAADCVHRLGERLVRLRADRPERHRRGGEADADIFDRLDLLDRDRPVATRDELEQVVQRHRVAGLDVLDILLVLRRIVIFDEGVEVLQDRVGDRVALAIAAVAQVSRVAQLERFPVGHRVAVGFLVPGEAVCGDLLEPDAADLRMGPVEALLDERLADPDRLENLGALVAVEHRDPHLRHDLEQALLQAVAEVLRRGGEVHPLEMTLLVVLQQLADGRIAEVRTDSGRPVAEQAGHLVRVARLAGIGDQATAHALALAVEVVVDCTGRHDRRDRNLLVVDPAVGDHDDLDAIVHRGLGLGADPVDGSLQPAGAIARREGRIDRHGGVFALEALDLRQLLIEEDRRVHVEDPGVFRRLAEPVALAPEPGAERHHQALADRVDRRVGHLGEQLLEIREQQARLRRQHAQGDIVPHAVGRLDPLLHHRDERDIELLLVVAVGDLLL